MSAVLVLDGLVKNFGSLKVTDNVSLELRHDECHALIGPNGAGKSTLINLVAGNLALERLTTVHGHEGVQQAFTEVLNGYPNEVNAWFGAGIVAGGGTTKWSGADVEGGDALSDCLSHAGPAFSGGGTRAAAFAYDF